MKSKKRILVLFMCVISVFAFGCKNTDSGVTDDGTRVVDERTMSAQEYTVANIASTDALGRTVRTGDEENGDTVGLFYFLWNGAHRSEQTDVYDITKLLENDPDALWSLDPSNLDSPFGQYHYWGEPLYGYYYGGDPWVMDKHIELFSLAGIDYLVMDASNAFTYDDIMQIMFEELDKFQKQGWNVPKIAFYTMTNCSKTVGTLYNQWYRKGLYEDLWYKIDGKPLIITNTRELSLSEETLYDEFFHIRESQWPTEAKRPNSFPWIAWEYPQTNHQGTVSCSIAQHPSCKMSQEGKDSCNYGRGFDHTLKKNIDEKADEGTNFAQQWDTVFNNRDEVDNVFITGWNEWIAIKYHGSSAYSDDEVFFVDTFNKAYSRDIEMMKGGYGDNFYLQMASYIKRFKYTEPKHYLYNTATVNLNNSDLDAFDAGVRYKDFQGDTANRKCRAAAGNRVYTDTTGRNDITDIQVIHDDEYAYFRVQTAKDITEHEEGDLTWMNLLIKVNDDVKNTFGGYAYAINRKPGADGKTSVEKSTGGYAWENAGEAEYRVHGNAIVIKVPLSAIGVQSDNVTFEFKVSDHVVTAGGGIDDLDISDYYVTGDSAPIGRLSYSYGY